MKRLLVTLLLAGCAALPEVPLTERHAAAEQAYQAGDWDQAVTRYAELVQAVPDNVEFRFRLANGYVRSGRLPEAAAAYQEVLVRDAGHGRAWYNLGLIELERSRAALEAAEASLPAGHPARARARALREALPRPSAREGER